MPGTDQPAQLNIMDELPLPVTDLGVNVAVAPAGSPLATNVTTPLKPASGDIETEYVFHEFWVIVRDAGLAVSEKSVPPAELTFNVTCVLCCRVPPVPVMVSGKVPGGVLASVFTVSVEEPEPLTEVGLKLAVTPAGRPLTEKFTVPEKPFVAVTVVE